MALQFDGVDSYVDIPLYNVTNYVNGINININFKTPASNSTYALIGSDSNAGYILITNGGITTVLGSNGVGTISTLASSTEYDLSVTSVGSKLTISVVGMGSIEYDMATNINISRLGKTNNTPGQFVFDGSYTSIMTMSGGNTNNGGDRSYNFDTSTGTVLTDTTSGSNGTLINFDGDPWAVVGDNLPTASSVSFSGTMAVGSLLTSSYVYNDIDGDIETTSTFNWYASNDAIGTGKVSIATTENFTLTSAQENKYISFEVTPVNAVGTGTAYESAINATQIPGTPDTVPTASSVSFSGTMTTESLLTGSYTYDDVDSDVESGSTFNWYMSDDVGGTNKTSVGTSSTYILAVGQIGKFISFEVTPSNANGTGIAYESSINATAVTATPTVNGITVTDKFKSWQRDQSGNASVTITGTFTGTPTTIERQVDAGAWTVADASPTGNVFSDTLSLAEGQYVVGYRFSNDVGVTDTTTRTSVSAQFAMAGQSNMSGRGTNLQTYAPSTGGVNATLFANDYVYKDLTDPFDSNTGGIDEAINFADSGTAGSWAVRMASKWLENSEVPITLIPVARGGASIAVFTKGDAPSNGWAKNGYDAVVDMITAAGGAELFIWQQGESDSGTTVNTTYEAALNTLANNIKADLGINTLIIPLHTLDAGYDGNGTTTGQAAIRAVQIKVASENPNVSIAAPLTSIDSTLGVNQDGVHLKDDADLETAASIAYTAMLQDWESIASNVTFTGVVAVGNTLTGSYTYYDYDGDSEATSTFNWYASDDAVGTGKSVIGTSLTYLLTGAEVGKYISFEVTPVSTVGSGSPVESTSLPMNSLPTATSVSFTGTLKEGEVLLSSYTYGDIDSDAETVSTFKWYMSDDASGTNKTQIATSENFTLTVTQVGKFISFEVVPVNAVSTGLAVESSINVAAVLAADSIPTATSVTFSGSMESGQGLSGTYIYGDVDSDTETTSTFNWYMSDDTGGTAKTQIGSSQNFTLTDTQIGKFISFEVTPVNALATGLAVESSINVTSVIASPDVLPVASAVSFSGTLQEGQLLSGTYTYSDSDGDSETTTTFNWYMSDDTGGTNKTSISTSQNFTLTAAQLGKFISFEVTPVNSNGTGSAAETSINPTQVISSSGASSDVTISITGIPDGTYVVTLLDTARPQVFIESTMRVFTSGSTQSFTLSVAAGTLVYGFVRDNLDPSSNGAWIRATTV